MVLTLVLLSFFVIIKETYAGNHTNNLRVVDVLNIDGVQDIAGVQDLLNSNSNLDVAKLLQVPGVTDIAGVQDLLDSLNIADLISLPGIQNLLNDTLNINGLNITDIIKTNGVLDLSSVQNLLNSTFQTSDLLNISQVLDIGQIKTLLDNNVNLQNLLNISDIVNSSIIQNFLNDLFSNNNSIIDNTTDSSSGKFDGSTTGVDPTLPNEENKYGYGDDLTESARLGATICEEGLNLNEIDERSGSEGTSGGGGGTYVPVKDFEAEDYLKAIWTDIHAIQEDADINEDQTQAIRYYMRRLCEKEYIHDVQFQNMWAEVIGNLVNKTMSFVSGGYNNNPIFVTNQYAYYTLVDLAVFKTFIQEIDDSNIGEKAKREIIKSLKLRQFENIFPYKGEDQWAPDDITNTDGNNEGDESTESWTDYFTLFNREEKSLIGLFGLAEKELQERREQAIKLEREKLQWGRGFFSYEFCDLNLFSNIREDRRNCRIATPGALIQDQVTLVFGTALRQMEQADGFEHKIAQNSFIIINDILNKNGLRKLETSRIDKIELDERTKPLSPTEAGALIEFGKAESVHPWEFETVIDEAFSETENQRGFERRLIDLIEG